MATDYDAPRKTDEEMSEDSIEELKTRRSAGGRRTPRPRRRAHRLIPWPGGSALRRRAGADPRRLLRRSGRRRPRPVRVLPRQQNEFTCASCFLVKSRSQLAESKGDLHYCVDCV